MTSDPSKGTRVFTLSDTPVKFIGLLILFVICTVWSVRELTRPQTGRQRISNALHLAMAVVMLLMVARSVWTPIENIIPITLWTGLFAVGTGWFGYLAISSARSRSDGASRRYAISHTLMFAAMTWHLAAMAIMGSLMAGSHDHSHGDTHGHDHGAAMNPMAEAGEPGGSLWWAAVIGVPLMIYLLGGAIVALTGVFARSSDNSRMQATVKEPVLVGAGAAAEAQPVPVAATCHEPRPVGSAAYRLGNLSHFAMLFGMFWMSTGILVPIAPFMAHLAF